ncbi:carbohydrate ABC transporter permease [Occultella aeris]|uniref:Lactose transport system permease protein LacF n=1 Tax=Occultella aeris TaxID=2761496 RepID=A0A7M4DDQ9_9MICO|nr:sugar ABC transporter permease [Occultella aeris]VZO34979.1 Lactose transport system permease protein LacF [Occultella aeris]
MDARARRTAAKRREYLWCYLLLLPLLLAFGGFTLWPIVASWWYSFFDWDGVGNPTEWVGLANFAEVLTSPDFWRAFWHSFLFSLVAILIELPLALAFAILLNNGRLRGRNVYRLALFVPVVTTTAVVGIVFVALLDPVRGAVNEALLAIGLVDAPINFLGSTTTALPSVMAIDLWKGFGISLIYWLAALQTVPKDLIEAAQLDGARKGAIVRHVMVPVMAPIAIVIMLLLFQRSLGTFDLVQAMTAGGPVYSTDVVPTFIYRFAFSPEMQAPRYGFACAAGVVFGLLTLALTLLQAPALRYRKRVAA